MKLSTKTRYGVPAVFDLAYHCGTDSCRIKNIADRQSISVRYLVQIVHRLKKAGNVKSERGSKGGYALSRLPETITIGDIYRATEGVSVLAKSRRKESQKGIDAVTTQVWNMMTREIGSLFDSITIRSMCKTAEELNIPKESEKDYIYFI